MAKRDSLSDKKLEILKKLVNVWGPDVWPQLHFLQRILFRTVPFCKGQQQGLQRTNVFVVLRDTLAHPIYRADKMLEVSCRFGSLHGE